MDSAHNVEEAKRSKDGLSKALRMVRCEPDKNIIKREEERMKMEKLKKETKLKKFVQKEFSNIPDGFEDYF